MRLHSDFIEADDVRKAARLAGVHFTRFGLHGSRKRAQAFDVILSGSSSRRQNGGDDYAATWDEWGSVLGYLFALDSRMVTPYYSDAADFDFQTGGQYRGGALPVRHKLHKWHFQNESFNWAYSEHRCECGAVLRRKR